MLAEWHIAEADWHQTPQSVHTVLLSLSHHLRLLRIRCAAYKHQAQEWKQQALRTAELEARVAELAEFLHQNSRNSSKPPSTDSPATRPRRKHFTHSNKLFLLY